MPTLTGVLEPEGALVTVEISLSRREVQRRRHALQPIPAAVSLRALIDTGSECSCADSRALALLTLPLKSIGLANLPAAGGLTPTTFHDASLTVVHPSGDARVNLVVGDLPLAEVSLAALGYEALVGRDVLGQCRFLYDGRGGRYRLSY